MHMKPMRPPAEQATDQADEALEWLVGALKAAAGDNLVSLTLTTSTKARPEDLVRRLATLTIVLHDTGPAALGALRETLREASRRVRVSPYVLAAGEVDRMLDALPLKALMTRVHGRSLLGENPFAGCDIDPDHVRLRLEQESRNLLVRLRHDLVLAPDDGHLLHQGLWRTVRGVERVLDGLAVMKHGERAVPADLWAAGHADWDLPAEPLAILARFGDGPTDLHAAGVAVLPLLEALVARTDAMGP